MNKPRIVMLFFLNMLTGYGAHREPRDVWILPNSSVRYDQICFLTAHNAFASKATGWHWCRQQNLTLIDQLTLGVRGFMLDTYEYRGTIALCHGGIKPWYAFQRSLKEGFRALRGSPVCYQTLRDALTIIVRWLNANPQEIVTIFLENYVDNRRLTQEIRAVPDLLPLVFTPQERIQTFQSSWPTLAWMQEHNKRLVLFNENKSATQLAPDDPFASIWDDIIESSYGTLNRKKLCKERPESAQIHTPRSLYLLNHFPFFAMTDRASKQYNSYHTLKKAVEFCQKHRLAGGKKPNFIALDFVDQGNSLRLINELNHPSLHHKMRDISVDYHAQIKGEER